jgi:glycosyltransferase involved in cell wall biosynthesis
MTTSAPTFSVVIPAHEAQATISSAVSSVLSQTRTDLEVLVIDDGSTDGTAAVAERLADPRVQVFSQPNRGLSAARNTGIGLARGTYISFLDADDLWLPRYLELAERALRTTTRPGFAYTDAYGFDPVAGKVGLQGVAGPTAPVPPPPDPDLFLLKLLERNFVYVSTTIPRDVVEAVGGFDETLPSVEDYELWLRIVTNGYRPAWMPGKQALYRVHDGQMSRDLLTMMHAEHAALATVRMEDLPTDEHREVLARRRNEIERELRILEGRALLASTARRVRLGLRRLRDSVGLGGDYRDEPPPEVSAAFPDLTAV